MPKQPPLDLSRRERQIMDIIYERGEATAAEVHERLSDPPTYTAVRGLLRILEAKGHLAHRREGSRYIYRPLVSKDRVGETVLRHVVRTFFDGSASRAVAARLGRQAEVSAAELAHLTRLIAEARAREDAP